MAEEYPFKHRKYEANAIATELRATHRSLMKAKDSMANALLGLHKAEGKSYEPDRARIRAYVGQLEVARDALDKAVRLNGDFDRLFCKENYAVAEAQDGSATARAVKDSDEVGQDG